jgi:hypothetical protein
MAVREADLALGLESKEKMKAKKSDIQALCVLLLSL